jgi:cytochrome c-type protein NapB
MKVSAPSPDPHHQAEALFPVVLRRFIPLLAATGIGLALFGFISGIRDPAPMTRPDPPEPVASGSVPPAVNYSELPTSNLRPNTAWQQSLSQLKFDRPGPFDPVTRTEEMKLDALVDRARNRAYDGAPPTIPHPVAAHSADTCLACHGEGLKVGDRVASRMSHSLLTNCMQCHVEQMPEGLANRSVTTTENTFTGVFRAGPGDRASPGAPPTIPHHTWMRENCLACHGLITRAGTRTTHPWLSNCAQCHAPSAALDQVEFVGDR